MFKKACVSLALFGIFNPSAHADSKAAKPINDQNSTCGLSARPDRLSLRHIEGNGIGYQKGYSTLELFLAPRQNESSIIPFLDLRGHVFNDGKYAANAGIGCRYLSGERIWGINAFYDFRQARRSYFQQGGIGLEALGVRWDFRANGYLPFGAKKTPYFDFKETTQFSFSSLTGNQINLQETVVKKKKRQFAMKGADAEAAFHITKSKKADLYAAIGPYYFHGSFGKHAFGAKARLGVRAFDIVTLEGNTSYDNFFHTIVQGTVGLTLPFGKRASLTKKQNQGCLTPSLLSERLYQPIQREEIIVAGKHRKKEVFESIFTAIDPATGQPYSIIYVNNTNPNAGNGTFEDPFQTLLLAQGASAPGNIIYVFQGDGTTSGMNQGFVMKNNQQLLGSGIPHPIITPVGMITIPALTPGFPMLTSSGTTITLANNDLISGLNIAAPNTGISGQSFTNASIVNNVISNIGDDGILIVDVSGVFTIENNTISNVAAVGINLSNGFINSTDSQIFITNNQFINNSTNSLLLSYFQSSTGSLLVNNNTSSNEGGFSLEIHNSTVLKANFDSNVINTFFATGIDIETFDSSALCLKLNRNTVTVTGGFPAFLFDQFDTSIFDLEPPMGNNAPYTVGSGVITSVPTGTCTP